MIPKKIIASILCVLCFLNFTACANSSGGTNDNSQTNSNVATNNSFKGTPEPDMVTIDILAEPSNLNPILIQDGTSAEVLRLCLSGLTRLDGNDMPQADLAEKWDISDDGLTYTFYLKKDAKWANGDPIIAEDYIFSWTKQMTQSVGAPQGYMLYERIKNGEAFYNGTATADDLGIKAIDDHTIEITWEKPYADALYLFTIPPFQPVNKSFYESMGEENYAKSPEQMLTNGPYTITKWVHDDSIMLEKNENYVGSGTANIPKIKLVMLSDSNARLNAFLAGQLDVCNISGDQIDQIKEKSEGAVKSYIDNNTWFLRYNLKNEFLANENIRKALGLSLDIQSLLDNVIKDGSIVADGIIPSSINTIDGKSYATTRENLFAYDVDEAKSLFEKGLKELNITAADVKLDLMSSDTTYGQTQSAYMQQQWKQNLGIDVSIRALPWKARIDAEYSGDFDMIPVGWPPESNDPIGYLTMFLSDNPNNTGGYNNPEFDKLVAEAMITSEPVKRQTIIVSLEKMLVDEAIVSPMYFSSTSYAISAKIEGLHRSGFQTFDLCNGAKIISTK